MPFALLLIGLLMVVTGFQDTYVAFGQQIQKDFTGSGNFTYWLLAIFLVGALGYVQGLENFSRAFMVLIIVAIFLNKGNSSFFSNFSSALSSGTTSSVDAVGQPLAGSGAASGGSSASSSTGLLGSVISKGATSLITSAVSAIGSFL